jgi:glycosyltransferase involved in cell wall biosynthesis
MKVLHVGKFFAPFRGGVENYMRDAMVAMNRQGIACFAVVHRHEWSFRSIDDLLEMGKARFHVIRAGTWFKFMYTPFSPMFPVLMQRYVRLHQPDVLHLHMPNPSAFWALLLRPMRKVPWVVHWHADVVNSTHDPRLRWFYHLYRPLEQRLLRRAQAIIVTSQTYLDFSKPLQAHRSKCHVVPLGLDSSMHQQQNEQQAKKTLTSNDPLRVLAIGRLTYYKGFEYLIQAAALLPHILVEIVGKGDQKKKLESLIIKLGVEDRVVLRGALSDHELQQRLNDCDCLCLPSIERTEAFGMVLLEAMLYSKAVVVSDVPGSGMGWIVEQGRTGIKVKPADAQALADALQYLQQNPGKAQSMGRRGRERYENQFQIDRSAASLIQVYKQVAAPNTQEKSRSV